MDKYVASIVNIIHFKAICGELNIYSCCLINDSNLTLLLWSRVLLAQKCRPEMWLLRAAPAAGADREWISVVSYNPPAWPPTKRTICGLTPQTPAHKELLILITLTF